MLESLKTTPKRLLSAGGVILVAGLLIALVGFMNKDDEKSEPSLTAGADAYMDCVTDAALHLNSVLDITMDQALSQASTSPRCAPLDPRGGSLVTASAESDSVWPADVRPSQYAGLYRALCRGVDIGVPARMAIDKITGTQTAGIPFDADRAERVYYDAIAQC